MYQSGAEDKVVRILEESGRMNSVLAKHTKRSSKKSSTLELGNYVTLKIINGYALPIVSEIKIINEYRLWKLEYTDIFILQLLCETIGYFCVEDVDEPALFELLSSSFQAIEQFDSQKIAMGFLIKLLQLSGNLPKLNECSVSGQEITSDSAYTWGGGIGYIHQSLNHPKKRMSERIFKSHRYTEHHTFEEVLRLKSFQRRNLQHAFTTYSVDRVCR